MGAEPLRYGLRMRKKLGSEKLILIGLGLLSILALYISYCIGLCLFVWYFNLEQVSVSDSLTIFYIPEYKDVYTFCQLASSLPVLLAYIYLLFGNPFRETTFGDAHFARLYEILKEGFFQKKLESIVIGKKYGLPLYSNGFEHILCFAPTGSGKTTSIAIPNLLTFPFSVVANDVKLTLYDKTANYREKNLGHTCYIWAPGKRDGKTHCFNPLDLISADRKLRMTDIQRISHIMIPDPQSGDPIWSRASRKLFKALVLYLLDEKGGATLSEINSLIKQESFNEWLEEVLNETEHLDKAFYENGFSYINNHEKTRDSILETFSGYFELFDDPLVSYATSKSDFDLRALRKEKITIYVGFSDDDMERLAPIINLFWQQLISSMIHEVPDLDKEPYPLLCLMDEFSSLGRIERLRRSLKLLREYRVRCVLMMQYLAQTMELYTQHEARAFLNIKTKISFGTDDIEDAGLISKIIGERTIRVGSSSHKHGFTDGGTANYSYQAAPLLRTAEILRMNRKANLIMKTGCSPLNARKLSHYT